MSSQTRASPRKRGGKTWRGKKKSSDVSILSQGIPHLSNSFVSEPPKEISHHPSITGNCASFSEQYVETQDITRVNAENENLSDLNNKENETLNNNESTHCDTNIVCENKDNSIAILSSEKEIQNDKNAPADNLECNQKISTNCEEKSQSNSSNLNVHNEGKNTLDESRPESSLSYQANKTLEKEIETQRVAKERDKIPSFQAINKKSESKFEYISEYSTVDASQKLEPGKNQSKGLKPDENIVQIGPLQPVVQLVDPVQLEKETEQYYKEMGTIPNITNKKPAKTPCLTPGQIAKITKDYPQVLPNKDKVEASEKQKTAWTLLHQYWTFVQENPYDFDGWTALLNHVETIDNIEAARSAFEGFLPLYPYCFAYWMKFSDLELKFTDLEKAIGVLYLGTKCVPFCTDLWVPLINKFIEYAKKENISDDIIRGLCEHSLGTLGLSWNSSSVWEACINYEMNKGDLVRVMNLYKRVLSIPTKLYNKHWDHLLALVRDYHPRNLLTIEEYSNLKRNASDILKIKFTPPTLEAPATIIKVTQPEDKIHTTIKEKIVAALIPIHEANEKECEKRWKFEEKIKRPYFHVKALEKKQLKTWKEYLEFEMKEGDPVRIINLFERCLVPCAMYEELWCKYASYMEDHVLNIMKAKYANIQYKPGCFSRNEKSSDDTDADISIIPSDSAEVNEIAPDFWVSSSKELEVTPESKYEVALLLNRLSEGIGVGGRVLTPPPLIASSILRELTWEDVRQIYRRAAWIHCPSKPLILMQWAEFEESQENVQTARELLNTVIVKHPKLLKVRIQLIELERRSNELDRVEELYAQTFAIFNENKVRSFIAIRYARFLFKIREQDDKALLILRKALKKDKGNIHLYHHVFDICYQRRPVDSNGVLASVMLALASKELSLEDKYWFCIKRSEFLKEHGTMTQVKESKAEMEELKLKLDKDQLIEAKFEKMDEENLKKEKEDSDKKKNESASGSTETSINDQRLKDGKEENSRTGKRKEPPSHPQLNGVSKSGRIISPLVNLFKPPAPPILEPVSPASQNEGKEEKECHRDKKRRREDKDDATDGHRHKRKSSKKDKKSSRRSKKEGRHRKRAEEGEIEEGEVEEIVDLSGEQMSYNPGNNVAAMYNNINSNNNNNNNNNIPQMQRPQEQTAVGMENKPYQAVAPTWDITIPPLANYGYGGASDVVKDGQNSLYERYYDMIKQGYQAKDREGNNIQMQQSGPGTNIIIGNNNSYLPPPPMPQGILGESLFNQGKLENLHAMQGKQGNLTSANNFTPLFPPPPCIPPGFPRNMQPPNKETKPGDQLQFPPLPFLPNPPMAGLGNMPIPANLGGQLNPGMMQGNHPNLNSNPGEPRMKMPRMDSQSQMNMNEGHGQGLLGDYPASKSMEKEGRGGRNKKKGRGDSSRQHHQHQQQQQNQNQIPPQQPQPNSMQTHQQQLQQGHQSLPPFDSQPPYDNNNKSVPLIGMNIRELLQDNLANSLCNVPEWLVKEGGELRLSESANGSSIIRYWPRYMNDTGHQTLFQSLRKTVKWHQQRYLIGSPSENNWVSLPKLLSWIGPCTYEKDGMFLSPNTQWPPEVVDLLHRLIHFSNSQFNSCLMSLYNTGYSNQPWHSEVHEAMPKNPTTACISLGVTRILEMKRKNGAEYLRFPLFPGSLFVMEGACHADWLCQIPKEPQIKGERIDLSFRTMLMIKGVTV